MDKWIALAQEAQALPWVPALEVIGISVVVAKIVDLLISRLLLRLALRTNTDLDDQLIQLLHRPVFVSVILVGLHIAVNTLGWNPSVEQVLVALIRTVAIFVWTVAGFKLTSTTLKGLSRLADRVTWLEARTLPLFSNLSTIVLLAMAVYSFLIVWNLDLSAWLASAGIMGIAVGFAAKDSLANLFGGLSVIMDGALQARRLHQPRLGRAWPGDQDRAGQHPVANSRRCRKTLPNAHIASAKVVNESGGPYEKTRVAISVGVVYGSDVDQVKEVLQEAAQSVEFVVNNPAARIRFVEMGDSSLLFQVQAWIDEPCQRGICIDGLNTAIYKALDQADIQIPFPQRVVHVAHPPSTSS